VSLPRRRPPAEPEPELVDLFENPDGVPLAVQRQADFFVFFSREAFPVLEAQRGRLAALYCPGKGRPAWDPVRLLGAVILQCVLRMTDRLVAEAVQFDVRWRLALRMRRREPTFDPSLLVVFRGRLVAGNAERLAFGAVLDYLVEKGWVARRSRQRLDSTHVWGAVSDMSRLDCLRETLRVLLVRLRVAGLLPEEWEVYWQRYVESKIDPRAGKTVLKAKTAEAGADMLAIWRRGEGCEAITARDEFRLMQLVFLEFFEVTPEGSFEERKARPAGAVNNPHDPQAQWSTKSTTKDKDWVGYKVQVAETVRDVPCASGEPTANFLTAVVTQDAIASDKVGMAEVLREQEELRLDRPEVLYVDGAYVSSELLHQAQQENRQLRGPAPGSPDRGKVYTVEAFDVHLEDRYAICPGGQPSSNCSRLEAKDSGKVCFRIEWNGATCDTCSLRGQCISSGQRHRTIVVGDLHLLLQARRREMQTDAFKEEMHRRNGIEGTQSEMVRGYGLRRARYRGKAKVRLQNWLIGAACNLRRLHRRMQWEAKVAPDPRGKGGTVAGLPQKAA
jgi:transposase